MADGSITIDTKIDDSGVKKGVNSIESGFDKLKSTVIKTISAIGLGKLTKDFISTGVQYNAEIEKYQTALTTLTGSAEEANKIIKQIKEDAAKTPFDVAGLTQANQLLISTGLSAEDSRETILALGNAVSATGGGNEELSRMAVNLQQIKNTGKAAAIDIKQFAFAGIDIYGLLADYLGITKKEAAEMEVTWDDLNGALLNASKEGGKYFGAMTNQSTTLNGQWSTLKDNFKEFTGEAMQPLTNLLKDTLLPVLNDLITGGESIKNWINEHSTLITILTGIIATLAAAMIAYTIAKNADLIVTGLYVAATNAATIASTAFGAVMAFITSPITLVILAIGALITIVVLLVKNWDTVKEKTFEVFNKISTFISSTVTNIKNKISQIISQIVSTITNPLSQLYNSAVTWGKDMIQGFINGIKSMINSLTEAVKNVGNKIKEFLHFSRPDKGPLRNYETWMPDMVKGLTRTLNNSSPELYNASKKLSEKISEGFDLSNMYNKMKTAVDFQAQKLSANLSTTANMNRVITVNMNLQGDIDMDSTKVGRLVAPAVSKTLRTGGAY